MAVFAEDSTTLTELRRIVNTKLGNYVKSASSTTEGDGVSAVFELPHSNLVPGTITVTVAGTAVSFTTDEENGVVTLAAAPAAGAVVIVNYQFLQWVDEEVDYAINEGMYEAWAEFHVEAVDDTTVAANGDTEHALPTNCAYLFRVEFRSTSEDPWLRVREWSAQIAGVAQALYLYKPESSGEYRLRYIKTITELSAAGDTLEGAGIPTTAKWGIVWTACSTLLGSQLARRVRSNRFYNVEGPNVPKVYELQRVMADFRSMADLAFKKARKAPHFYTT